MATKRVVTRLSALTSTSATTWATPDIHIWNAVQAQSVPGIVPITCTIKNLFVTLQAAPGVGASRTITLVKNGSDTNLTITISGTNITASDTSHKVNCSAGDTLVWRADLTGTPASAGFSSVTYDIDGSVLGESCYFLQSPVSPASFTRAIGVFQSNPQTAATNTANARNISPVAGVLSAYYVNFQGTIVSGSVTFTVYKNGVAQDGTAGTPNTTGTASSGSSFNKTGFSLSIAEGDDVYIVPISSSLTIAKGTDHMTYSTKFTATTDGQSAFVACDTDNFNLSNTTVNYKDPLSTDDLAWNATEANRACTGGISTFTLSRFRVRLNNAPGASKQYVFDWRKNGATPSNPPSVTISGTTTPADGSDLTNTLTVTSADTFNLRSTPTSTPTSTYGSFSAIQTALATSGNSGNTKSQGGRGHKGSVTSNKTVFGPNLFLTFDDIESYGVG